MLSNEDDLHFDPPLTLAELVAQADEEEWALAATSMMLRMIQAVVKRGVVPIQWAGSLRLFGLVEENASAPPTIFPSGYIACQLTASGMKAAKDMMVIR